MNISEYPFSTFIGIDISKDKIDIAELKGAAGKTIGNNKKEICRWITSLKETSQTIVVMEATSRSGEPGAESTAANRGFRDPQVDSSGAQRPESTGQNNGRTDRQSR